MWLRCDSGAENPPKYEKTQYKRLFFICSIYIYFTGIILAEMGPELE